MILGFLGDYSLRYSARGLVVADVNADGRVDCVASLGAQGFDVLTNNGAGVFGRHTGLSDSELNSELIATADFNGDNLADLVVRPETPKTRFYVLLNQGGTNYTVASTNTLSDDVNCLSAADLYGNALSDLAVGSDASSDGLLLFYNQGQGRFTLGQTLAVPGPTALLITDLNGNKLPDLVRVEKLADNLAIMPGAPGLNYGGARLGLGRYPAANQLEVEGDASKSTAGSWLANSDRRIKQEIAPVTNALETLAKVRLVSFRYTDAYRAQHPGIADRRYLNVVAQEFAEVFPDAVTSSGEKLAEGGDEILQVDTYPLTIYSAAAIHELQQALDKKDNEIRELKARLEELERRFDGQSGTSK
jgi:hypothetical protein